MRRTRRQCNRQQSRASRKMRRSSRLAHEAPVMLARRTTTRALPRIFRLIWIPPTTPPPPEKTYLNPCNQKRKILAKLSNPKKSRNRKFQTPKTEFLRSGPVTWNPKYYPSPPAPPPPAWLQDLWASETEKPSLMPSQFQELLSRREARRFPMFCCPRFLCILVKIF